MANVWQSYRKQRFVAKAFGVAYSGGWEGELNMLDKRLAVTIFSVVIVSAMAAIVAMLPREEPHEALFEPAAHIPVEDTSQPVEVAEEEETWLYLIREHEGRIAVFSRGEPEPVMVLDKLVKHLPEYDQIQMQDGIAIHSEQELAARIEDYTG